MSNLYNGNVINRWINDICRWFDYEFFDVLKENKYVQSSKIGVPSFWLGVVAGVVIFVSLLFNIDDTFYFYYWIIGSMSFVIVTLALAYVIVDEIDEYKRYNSLGRIVGRMIYLLLFPLLLALAGGVVSSLILAVTLISVLSRLFIVIFFGSRKKIKLSNGDILEDGGLLFGGLRGKNGDKYKQNIDGTYSKKIK